MKVMFKGLAPPDHPIYKSGFGIATLLTTPSSVPDMHGARPAKKPTSRAKQRTLPDLQNLPFDPADGMYEKTSEK